MHVYHDKDAEMRFQDLGRDHPWSAAESDPANRYVDFRKSPELIKGSLEDFKPYADRGATQQFYDLVRWLNGDAPFFETNDSAFRGPYPNAHNRRFNRTLEVRGRLTLFYQNLLLNTDPTAIDWLCESLEEQIGLQEIDLHYGCISYARWPHMFMDLARKFYPEGNVLALHFWAWGNTDDEVFENLGRLVRGLRAALGAISDFIKESESRRQSPSSENLADS